MELIYAAILLHKAGKEINEENIKKVLESVGIQKTEAEIKALVAALDGVDIEEAIKQAVMPTAAPAGTTEKAEVKEEPKEEKEEETKEAAAGLGSLFG